MLERIDYRRGPTIPALSVPRDRAGPRASRMPMWRNQKVDSILPVSAPRPGSEPPTHQVTEGGHTIDLTLQGE